MEMNWISQSEEAASYETLKTTPVYERKIFFWEIQSIDAVMTDGVQRAVSCDFNIGTNGDGTTRSKWRLVLDVVDDEPAITVEKLFPMDKRLYYRLSANVMKSKTEETDIISYPSTKLFYESVENCEKVGSREMRKFALHRQLAYGCSYTSWFKDVLVDGSLLLKLTFETCESDCV